MLTTKSGKLVLNCQILINFASGFSQIFADLTADFADKQICDDLRIDLRKSARKKIINNPIMKRIYKSLSLLVVFTAIFSFSGSAQNAWINEVHYDNAGEDVDEFIEVVVQNPGNYNLSDFAVVLYNGVNGESYDTRTLDVYTAGTSANGFTIYSFNYTADTPPALIQNGAPDGMALTYQGNLIPGQWLSYEGAFAATNGPASGLTSVDIIVLETNLTPIGQSLQLSGNGSGYGDFSWLEPSVATPGLPNNGQFIGPVGITEIDKPGVSVYPNPNNGKFNLSNNSGEDLPVTIYSVDGQKVTEVMLIPGDNQLALPAEADGIYIVRFSSKDGSIRKTERMVICR
jgi:hypothetical protein